MIPGVTQGFKTFIKLMVSLDPKFTVTGIAITESEEDPGLGAEIEQNYFRNQFVGKSVDILKNLKVVKDPLPPEYLKVLEPLKGKGLSPGTSQGDQEQIPAGRYLRAYGSNHLQPGRNERHQEYGEKIRLPHGCSWRCSKKRQPQDRVLTEVNVEQEYTTIMEWVDSRESDIPFGPESLSRGGGGPHLSGTG